MAPDFTTLTANAVDWAKQHLGSPDYALACLGFVEDAYEQSNSVEIFGGDYATESAEIYNARANSGVPPIGTFVFYDCSGPLSGEHKNWGHVGLSLGDGQVIHAWDEVRIDHYLDVERLEPDQGWDSPAYSGWVPVQRVFEGHRPREWSAEDDQD
ncbi:NlpC/P60 family protein [Sinosporangium siamense]|uniref:NlpC/P60 domain-containing protein n=1 Tax=Sinosporangium siamense TaxID=1367973 RepID=A0A919R9K5_9ACTN|nr:NlpC/P60 family protein [Sinosporangium siamense]GII89863.1 hypothetical protein Ssi02_00940 [Sinosporangium siamense]